MFRLKLDRPLHPEQMRRCSLTRVSATAHDAEATKGAVSYDGVDLLTMKPENVAKAGVVQVMEGRRIFIDLTVEENLRAGAHTRRDAGVNEEIEALMREEGIVQKRAPVP